MIWENRRQTILIIDDNPTNLKVVVEHLKAYSFDILTARNGEAGIERAQLAQPDLILLDVQMPGIDGFETCRRLKANPITAVIPIIFMTVLSETSDKVRGLEAGAVDFVTKPIDTAELLARVNAQLHLRALQTQLRRQNEQLEERVRERTAVLQQELVHRQQQEAEKTALLKLLHQQSDQLRHLTNLILENQEQHQGQAQSSQHQVDRDLTLLQSHIKQARQILLDRGNLSQTDSLLLKHLDNTLTILEHARNQSQAVSNNLEQAATAHQMLRANPLLTLSDREYEVFQLLAQGKSNTEIGEKLYLAKTTVSTYRRRIMDKLGVEDLPSLIKLALQQQIVS